MNVAQIYKDAKALIETSWTQGAMARDAEGEPLSSTDQRAVCWCTAGAIRNVGGVAGWDLIDEFVLPAGFREVTYFNDQSTKAEVLAAFDFNIARVS